MATRIVTPEYIARSLKAFNEFAGLKLDTGKIEGKKTPVLKDGETIVSRPMPIWMVVPYAEAYTTAKVGIKKASEMPRPIWPWDAAAAIKLQAKAEKEGKQAEKKAKKAAVKKAPQAKVKNPAPVTPSELKDPNAPKADGAKDMATTENAAPAAPKA